MLRAVAILASLLLPFVVHVTWVASEWAPYPGVKKFEEDFRLTMGIVEDVVGPLDSYLTQFDLQYSESPLDPWTSAGGPELRAGGYFLMERLMLEPVYGFPEPRLGLTTTDADGVWASIEEHWERRDLPGHRGAAFSIDKRGPILVLLHLDPIRLAEDLRGTAAPERQVWTTGEIMPLRTFEEGAFAHDAMLHYLLGVGRVSAGPTWNQSLAFWALEHAGLGGLMAAGVLLALTALACWVRFVAWALRIVSTYRRQIDHPGRLFGRLVVASARSQRAIVQELEARRVAAERALAQETAEQARRAKLARRETEPTPEPTAEVPPPSADQRQALIEAIEEQLSRSELTDAQRQRTRDEMSVALGQRNPWRAFRMLEHARDQLERAMPVLDGDEPRS